MELATPRLFMPAYTATAPFPPEVDLILSAISAGQHSGPSRRALKRVPYRVQARLRLFSDAPTAGAWTLFVRDINARGFGFLTSDRLPLGHGGVVDVPAPGPVVAGIEQQILQINCTLLRCREAAPGWFEGSIYFNREQPIFSALD
jgi:hypothetical protein